MENARRNSVDALIEFRKSDLLTAILAGEMLEQLSAESERQMIVVSNPPYVSPNEDLAPELRMYEPELALVAENGGLAVIGNLVTQFASIQKPGSVLLVEIGYAQAAKVTEMLRNLGLRSIKLHTDLAGKDRAVEAVI
jgi:release factor glutamine methyltransferase